jgi:hypothetical protein
MRRRCPVCLSALAPVAVATLQPPETCPVCLARLMATLRRVLHDEQESAA